MIYKIYPTVSVSYTHLDVYKRQALIQTRHAGLVEKRVEQLDCTRVFSNCVTICFIMIVTKIALSILFTIVCCI